MVPGLVRCCSSTGLSGVRRCDLAGRTGGGRDLGQAEVENLGVSALGHENVCGLDVAVDDSFRVGCIERIGNLDGEREDQLCFHWPACDAVLQRQAVQKLHDDEWLPVLLSDFMDGADVGMVECGGCLCFALKTGECLRIFRNFIGQKLQSNKAAELDVLGFINHAHAAAAELLHDAVVRDGLADHSSADP